VVTHSLTGVAEAHFRVSQIRYIFRTWLAATSVTYCTDPCTRWRCRGGARTLL